MQGCDFREDVLVELVELPVEVLPTEAGAEIASDHSVRIEHGHHIEDEAFAQHLTGGVIGGKESHQSLNQEGGMRLPWVDTTSDQHNLLLPYLLPIRRVTVFLSLAAIRNGEKRQVQSPKALGQLRRLHAIPALGGDIRYEMMESRVGIRDGVCEVHALVLLLEGVLELQLEGLAIKAVPANPFHPMHIVASLLLPLPVFDQFVGLEPAGVEVLALAEVAQVELHLSHQIPVADLEVVPAGVSAGVGIAPQEQIELVPLHPHRHVQVARLEGGVEVDVAGTHVQGVPFSIVAHPPDGLLDRLDVGVVSRSVPPGVLVLLVDLHGVGGTGAEEDDFEAVVGGEVGEEGVGVGVGVGEGERAGGQLGPPPEHHVRFQGVMVVVQYFPRHLLEVVSGVAGLDGALLLLGVVVLPTVVLGVLLHRNQQLQYEIIQNITSFTNTSSFHTIQAIRDISGLIRDNINQVRRRQLGDGFCWASRSLSGNRLACCGSPGQM